MEVENTLAYYKKEFITAVKSFIVQAAGYIMAFCFGFSLSTLFNAQSYKTFLSNLRNGYNKLERLSLAVIFRFPA
jgi:hypothetical protein